MTNFKPNLTAFSGRNDLVFVIDRFNYIEYLLTEILLLNIDPKKEKINFVRDYLLNNAIVPFSSKVKLFLHLNSIEKWGRFDKEKFHRIMHIRNQFAHSGKEEITIDLEDPECPDIDLVLESIKGNGKLERVNAETALHEFVQHFAYLKEKLGAIHEALRNKSG